jgi:hypothetical protein
MQPEEFPVAAQSWSEEKLAPAVAARKAREAARARRANTGI